MPDTPKSERHFIGEGRCSCGARFSPADPWAALNHALPLNIEALMRDVEADPNSPPELIASTQDLLARARKSADA